MIKQRVICAMSGGVDSSIAALLLKKQGYDVIGVFMKLWAEDVSRTDLVRENICCSHDAAVAAQQVCGKLKIPFYVVNFAQDFKKAVVDYYVKEYESGRTPNPCVICNRDIKGEILMRKAKDVGADYLATGHYARIASDSQNPKSEIRNPKQIQNLKSKIRNTIYNLYQAKDKTKDQTYFLWTLTQKHLAKLLFPVGDYTKVDIREMARKAGLPTAKRKESQGICFIPDRDVCGFLRRHAKKLTKPGAIVDVKGSQIGMHDGLVNYTIGQRQRLGIGGPKAYFVVKLDGSTNTLVVGDEKDLYQKELIAKNLNWIDPKTSEKLPITCGAKIRYGHPTEECRVEEKGVDQVKVIFKKAQRAITSGQSIVFYEGRTVLGGGVIGYIAH